jgi:hypothetical protein
VSACKRVSAFIKPFLMFSTDTVEKPVETHNSNRLANALVKAPNPLCGLNRCAN